jgi:hypothetical protein
VPTETARKNFQHKFYGKYVQWEGRVMRIDGNE